MSENRGYDDQDAEPTSTAPDGARPQSRPAGSGPDEPRTNIEAEAAAGGGPELDQGAQEDAELAD